MSAIQLLSNTTWSSDREVAAATLKIECALALKSLKVVMFSTLASSSASRRNLRGLCARND